jgi:hypothetical protein
MPVYTTAVTATANPSGGGAAYYTFHTAASRRAFLREKRTSTTTFIYSPVGLVYPSNTPVATTSTTPQPHDTNDAAATCALDTAWSTAPTIAVAPNWLEVVAFGPASGQILIETYPLDGQGKITIAKSTYLVAWNFGGANTGQALAVTVIYEE